MINQAASINFLNGFGMKVFTMRILTICFCVISTLHQLSVYAAEVTTSSDLAKAEFVKSIPLVRGGLKLLESSGDRLFFSMADGSVGVTDFDGKLLHSLQAKAGSDPVLKKPEAVALGAGVIYVADSDQNQIAMFSSEGKYLGSFGAKKSGFFASGGGADELKKPRGVAFHEGILYVLDSGSKRILMFGSNGVFLNPLDIRSGSDSKVAKGQGAEYKLRDPVEIKVDNSGRIYVLDSGDSLVKVYSPNGEYLRAILYDGALSGLAVAQDGIYVVKDIEYTIQKYDFNEKLIYRFGGKSDSRGQFMSVSGLAVLKDHTVILADTAKGVANFFVTNSGIPIEVAPKLATRTFEQFAGEIPVAVNKFVWDNKDTIYGIDTEQDDVVVIRNGKVEKKLKIANVKPIAIALNADGSTWLLDKKENRVIKFDATNGKIISSFGSEGTGEGQFELPTDLAISASGKVYVADKGRDSVQVFDSEGKFLSAVRKLAHPGSIAVDKQDNLYVLENANNIVSIYSAQGALISNLGKQNVESPGNLLKPVALMVTLDEVFVLDGNRVKVYSHQGEYLRSFGAKGGLQGELDEPTAIVQKDDTSFFIAERSNKRIQTFVTLYKPAAPQHFAAKNGLHSIDLNWEAVSLPYVKQYQIYRSKDEHAGFVRVGTSSLNQYVDRGLEADGIYFYYVSAETGSGYEGATSNMVSGTSKPYTPPKLESVDVVATPWQIKITWKQIESEFINSYFIYQKNENTFTKIGEAITPEFTQDSLIPNTKYTYYIAAHSSDGTEAEKFEVKASTQVFNKVPLEIQVLDLRPIFSGSYRQYEKDGAGTIRLTNNTNKEIEGLTLSFKLSDFMDVANETKLENLPAGKSVEVKIKAALNANVSSVQEDLSTQAMLEATYLNTGKRESYSKAATVKVYEKHKILWSEPERLASFITPTDSPLMSFVRSVVVQYKEIKDETQLAATVFDALAVFGLHYVQAPASSNQSSVGNVEVVDYVQFPRETLELKSGDGEDLVALYVAILESLGISTRVIIVPDHRFMMFSTGIKADDSYTKNDMYIIYDDMLWIPVETMMVGDSFLKAWEKGAANYSKWKGKELTMLDISKAWQTYKPVNLAESKWKSGEVSKGSIANKFPEDVKSIFEISANTKTRLYRQQLEKDPNDVESQLQIGIILAKLGDRKEAMKYFDKIVSLQPNNAAAFNNRGNLFMLDKKFADAQKAYRDASKASPEDPYIWINQVYAFKAVKKVKEAKEAFAKALSLDSGIKNKYKALALELSH